MIALGDDGTMDTVVYCMECGREYRFNFDADWCSEEDDEPTVIEYDAFVDECIAAITAEHVCGEDDE